MGLETAIASAVLPGAGQIINGQRGRAFAIWTGLFLSIVLFPLPVFGSITFAGIYIANIIDAYDPDNHFDLIHIKKWKEHSWDRLMEKIRENRRKD